ncbi:MAG TPA: hypothetical protein VD757_00490 [Candidatus Nitrosocosmicus sp.]|nr:hypothetical protein [Candidatus Nitrosocosmicus sp.]
MRLVARFPDQRQVGAVVDSLKNAGFDRKDMVISDLADTQTFNTIEEAAQEISFIKTERNGLGEIETFASGVEGLKGEQGIIVAVKTPKHESTIVRSIMEQSGAVEIIED